MRFYSKKREAEMQDYRKNRLHYLNENNLCKAKVQGCSRESTEIHHVRGRVGKLLNDKSNFMAVCRNCHTFIENNPNEARAKGWIKSRIAN